MNQRRKGFRFKKTLVLENLGWSNRDIKDKRDLSSVVRCYRIS